MSSFTILLIFASLLIQQSYSSSCIPEQIHISLSDAFTSNPTTNNTIRAIFHTQEECASAYISLTTPKGTLKITATAVNFFQEACPDGNYSTYVHVFDFPNLQFSQIYQYSCYGSDDAFLLNPVGPFQFYVPTPNPTVQQTKVVMFADMDASVDGMWTVNRLIDIAQNNFTNISAFIHNGDMAYNLQRDAGKKGDEYMNSVQKFTATMPYMITAGNHEDYGNFSNFNARFQMPLFGQSQNHYYSFNIGNMHFTSFNLDLVIINTEPSYRKAMLEWLEEDLSAANNNRNKQPWIIVYTHRPFYCAHPDDEDCSENHEKFADFEDILIKYNVDLVHVGHVHFYERMLPIKKNQVANFQYFPHDKGFHHYVNPQGPVHVLQGMAGHNGDLADPSEIYKGDEFTVMVSKAYSYMAVTSHNSTHLLVENFESKTGTVNDYFYIIKSSKLGHSKIPFYKN